MQNQQSRQHAMAIGASAGGLTALMRILESLTPDYPVPIIVVQHRSKEEKTLLEEILQTKSQINIKQADEKEPIVAGWVYFAPPNYHLLMEKNLTFSLSCDAAVNYSRPSIDVLFESAALAYRAYLIGILLTGSNKDGADGMRAIHHHGGVTIAQNPQTAEYPVMPQAALDTGCVHHVLDLDQIVRLITGIGKDYRPDECGQALIKQIKLTP